MPAERTLTMDSANKFVPLGLPIFLLLACALIAYSQPATGTPAPKPAATTPTTAAGTPAAAMSPQVELNPAVRTALELPRKEPRDYFRAILWLIDLGRPELAKPILDDLAKLQLTDAQRKALVDEFGSRSMLKLAQSAELAPGAAAFADACMAAAAASTSIPQRIDTLVKQLADPSPEARLIAQHDLAATGRSGAIATLEALARETDPNRRAALIDGIAAMHPIVDGMLLAMLETRDAALQRDVAAILDRLRVPQARPFMAAISDSTAPAAAERALATAFDDYRRGTPVFASDENDQVELWHWDDAAKKLSSVRVPASDARIIWMAKLARTLAKIRPQDANYQRQALVLTWEAAALDPATRGSASDAQPPAWVNAAMLNDVLAETLKSDYPHAAVIAANALARLRNAGVLLTTDGKPSPLADALVSPNRRVRFAALSAIMAIDPASPYPGSSRVPEALAWFAGSTAEPRAIVAMPTRAAAADLAGQLSAHGLSAEATNRGRELLNLAASMPDIEAIFVDMDILLPGIRDVLYGLRTNPTTGETPIAVLAADGRLEAAKRLAAQHRRIIAVPRPHSTEVVASNVKQLAELATADAVPAEERAAQASQAQAWLTKLESGRRPFYTFRRMARLDYAPVRREAPAPARAPVPNQ